MDDEHKMIIGYRNLSPSEIELMNNIKAMGQELGALCDQLATAVNPYMDGRWLDIGRSQLQLGLMALVRAVEKPDSF